VTGTRADDLGAWITATAGNQTLPPPNPGDGELGAGRWADFDGDGRDDYLVIDSAGAVTAYLNRGGGAGGWVARGKVANGATPDPKRVLFADFDGDGKADYLYFDTAGKGYAYLNRGGDGAGGWVARGKVANGATPDISRVRLADFDGDGKADYLYFDTAGKGYAYLNRGGDDAGGWVARGKVANGATADMSRVRLADFDGDGKADYLAYEVSGTLLGYLNRGGDDAGGWVAIPRPQ